MKKPLTALFWNIWGHRMPRDVHAHIANTAPDLACLVEVTAMGRFYDPVPLVYGSHDRREPPMAINGREQLLAEFSNTYAFEYHPVLLRPKFCVKTNTTYEDVGFGSDLLTRHELDVVHTDSTLLVLDRDNSRVLQHAVIDHAGKRYLVAHLHGVWIENKTKEDDPLREKQSLLVLWHLRKLAEACGTTRIIFGGDLNLDIDTKALALLEAGWEGMPLRNLVRENGITNTRTPAYRSYTNASLFADYVLVSPDVKVHEFSVDNRVKGSDHAPLWLSFS